MNIEPLYYCNLDCPLCDRQVFPTARTKDGGRLPLEIIDKIFNEVGDYLYQCQIFGQSEPLLDWKRSEYIIEAAHKQRIFTIHSTNSTLITSDMARDIEAGNLDYHVCAIDKATGLLAAKVGQVAGSPKERRNRNLRVALLLPMACADH